jgi:WD40 repeat protein
LGDHNAIVWDASTGKRLRKLHGHSDWVGAVQFSPGGRLLATGSNDRKAIVWDAPTGKKVHVLEVHLHRVVSVTFSHDGRWLASAGNDHHVILWDVDSATTACTLAGHTSSQDSGCLCILKDGWKVVRQSACPVTGHSDAITHLEFSPCSRLLCSASLDGDCIIWAAAQAVSHGTVSHGPVSHGTLSHGAAHDTLSRVSTSVPEVSAAASADSDLKLV